MENKEVNKVFTLALPPDLKAWLNKESKDSGMSVASLIRYILLRAKKVADKDYE